MENLELTWAGGKHDFALPIEQLRAIQQACDAGPSYILARLASGQWFVDDVLAPIRHGLEGAGADRKLARELVEKHVERDHLARHVPTAMSILQFAIFGIDEDDQVGEQDAGEAAAQPSPRAAK